MFFRWSLIAGRLPGRTDNEVKNYWNSHLRRKLINMGIDPNNHRLSQNLPRPQNLISTSSDAKLYDLKSCVTAAHQQPVLDTKSRGFDINNNYIRDQVSDTAGSCLLEDDSCGLPDLNLDLTTSIPFSPLVHDHDHHVKEGQKHNDHESNASDPEVDLHFMSPPRTLLLFQ